MKRLASLFSLLLFFGFLRSQVYVSFTSPQNKMPLVSASGTAAIYTDPSDHWLVQKAASLLASDIEKVTGKKPQLVNSLPATAENVIIIGSLDESHTIQEFVKSKKVDLSKTKGKWDGFHIQQVSAPSKGIKNALIIAGNDRRGTAYGVFDLSEQMGVSPWYWWADVPVGNRAEVYVSRGFAKDEAPAVKYRGIFINDEAPAFSGWTKEKFGGVNHKVYETIFELLLRMKGNYLWPAMWGNAFNDDDTLNPVLADKYGIVMGTTHHEPMLRAQQEWKRYGKGDWNYQTNDSTLRNFWRKGIQNMGNRESIVSVGMRGDGDMPMTQGTATQLLEKIVRDQRQIIAEVTGKDPSKTPQLWALYKEVQDYYDKGMRVPDDVTLLLSDDNWGNLRKLPAKTEKKRSGGYGIYYHFDYVGGPRNYKWINTNQIERVWEQMHLAFEYGVDRIWIVNVGDLKPMEFPINFFLDYAWDPNKWTADKLPAYYRSWAEKQFGPEQADPIGEIIAAYTKFNARRKPELLSPDTYSIDNYNEAQRVVREYNQLLVRAKEVARSLPVAYQDAFYELVLHPVEASANLNELYVTVAVNRKLAAAGDERANVYADKAKYLYLRDSAISKYYNDTLAGGKWKHMMDQTHIGYTYWQQPLRNSMPGIRYVNRDTVGNQVKPVAYGGSRAVATDASGYISIEAEHYTKAVETPEVKWKIIPNLGRTLSGVTVFPVTASAQTPSGNSPHLEYKIKLPDTATAKVHVYLSPTLNFHGTPLHYAMSIDDEKPQVVNIHEGNFDRLWNEWVSNNIIEKISEHHISKPGGHVLKFWMVDPAVVLQKIVIDLGGLKPSYLGPPENR